MTEQLVVFDDGPIRTTDHSVDALRRTLRQNAVLSGERIE